MNIKEQRVLFGKLQFCAGEMLPYDATDQQRQTLLAEVQTRHPKAMVSKRNKRIVIYGVWVDATPVQQAKYQLKIAHAKAAKEKAKLRSAALKERDFNRLVAKAKRLGYHLVPITG